jgi:hypothetical protein
MRWLSSLTMISCLILLVARSAPAQQQDISIRMRLTKPSILLGEPVWVDVTVTNRTTEQLRIDMGDTCFGHRPLLVEIPEAEPGSGEHKRCGLIGGSCLSSAPSLLDHGNTLTWRYVLAGDFRITHSGAYHVTLHKRVDYAREFPRTDPSEFSRNASEQTAKETALLEVRPADPAKLLAIEQALAAEVTAPYAEPPLPAAALPAMPNSEARRAALDAWQFETMVKRTAVAEGLANFPAAGMEPVFNHWLINDGGSGNGLLALQKLNTPESRRLVAQVADPSEDLYSLWRQHVHFADRPGAETAAKRSFSNWQARAVHALTEMGDRSYLRLLEKLAGDSSWEVRQEATLGLGLLGGESEVPKLAALAQNATNPRDRSNAIQAMGDTASLKAAPLLISLFTLKNADEPSRSNFALTTITHYSLPPADARTILETQALWQDWWEHNKDNARAYGPFECSAN